MSEEDRKNMEEVVKLIKDGYTKIAGILGEQVSTGEIRGFITGYLLTENDSDFEMFISVMKEYRDIIKSDTHE